MTAEAAAPGSPHPSSTGTISRCAVEEMGMNSVKPCTRPSTTASRIDIVSAKSHTPAQHSALGTPFLHLPDHRQNHRPPPHGPAKVALECGAHRFLQQL